MTCVGLNLVRNIRKPAGRSAFTLVEIMIVLLILGMLLAIVIPYYVRQRATAQANACINNLVKIDDAVCQFAMERGKKSGDPVTYPDDLTPYIKLTSTGSIPPCPAGGIYSVATVGTNPLCSLSTLTSEPHILQ
jgi:prepilin-type N-terminal cleavage/methylation domain-containing protein